jgi:hypothetical protein
MNKFIFPIAQLAGAAAFMPFEVLFLVTIVAAFVANIPLLKVRAARNSLRIRPRLSDSDSAFFWACSSSSASACPWRRT